MASVPSEPLPHGLSGRDEQPAYFAWMTSLFGDALSGVVLDHGAGTGLLTETLRSRVAKVIALEPDPLLFDRLERRFANAPNVQPLHGTIETYLASHGPQTLDAVISSNVLEHLSDDVACLRRMHAALRPGGAAAIYVPARQELFGRLDESVGHRRRYSRSQLRRGLEAAGFAVEWTRYANVAGVLPWLVSGRLLSRSAIESTQLRVFDRYVLPVSSRLEAWLRLPYGLNVAALARRQ